MFHVTRSGASFRDPGDSVSFLRVYTLSLALHEIVIYLCV